jgi:hypothetical protein
MLSDEDGNVNGGRRRVVHGLLDPVPEEGATRHDDTRHLCGRRTEAPDTTARDPRLWPNNQIGADQWELAKSMSVAMS